MHHYKQLLHGGWQQPQLLQQYVHTNTQVRLTHTIHAKQHVMQPMGKAQQRLLLIHAYDCQKIPAHLRFDVCAAVGGNGAKIDLDPGNANGNTPWYSLVAAPYYSGGELVHQASGREIR